MSVELTDVEQAELDQRNTIAAAAYEDGAWAAWQHLTDGQSVETARKEFDKWLKEQR